MPLLSDLRSVEKQLERLRTHIKYIYVLKKKVILGGLTPPAGCAVWDQIWEREDLIAFASSYHDSMLGQCCPKLPPRWPMSRLRLC